ncbi:ester cyclase [Lentzea sp. NPDC003310]|uniref:nuclear transport factor 2 family protein n=1 Tax=Lentzea sp. NPDC003310 TaxID=3154447 RepID=UPI0033B7F110
MSDLELNKKIVVEFYQTALDGEPEKAADTHLGAEYLQHNPGAQDGREAFVGFMRFVRGRFPDLRLHIKRVIAEGDLVVLHSHMDLEPGNPANPGQAVADIFRVENGKVVEHWDVIQAVPESPANPRGMF